MAERFVKGKAADIADILPGFGVTSTYNSPEEFARFIERNRNASAWQDSFRETGGSFYGTNTLDECLQIAQTGWKEGAEKADRIRGLISARIPRSPRFVKYGIAGSTPNVPRAVAGNLFNMKASDLAKSRRRPVLTIVSNMAVNCNVDTESISNHACVVAALIDQIEESGFACEVMAIATTSSSWGGGGLRVVTACRVKQSSQPVDLPRLSFSLGHAAFYRRLVFGDWGLEPKCSGLGQCLGSSCPVGDEKELNSKQVYVIPCSTNKLFKKEEDAMKQGLDYLILSLKVQGCPAFAKTKQTKDDLDNMQEQIKKLKGGDWDD